MRISICRSSLRYRASSLVTHRPWSCLSGIGRGSLFRWITFVGTLHTRSFCQAVPRHLLRESTPDSPLPLQQKIILIFGIIAVLDSSARSIKTSESNWRSLPPNPEPVHRTGACQLSFGSTGVSAAGVAHGDPSPAQVGDRRRWAAQRGGSATRRTCETLNCETVYWVASRFCGFWQGA